MPIRIHPYYCVACNKWEWDEPLVKFGAYYYHKACLDHLQAGISHTDDKVIFEKLNKAFKKLRQ